MEKLNQYAPIILMVCGLLVFSLNYFANGSSMRGYIGLFFVALGGLVLFTRNKKA